MAQPLVIVHGWSDDAGPRDPRDDVSFIHLGRRLAHDLNRPLEMINLAEWVSLNDDVTYTDLAIAMQRAWEGLPGGSKPEGFDIVAHSTGSLVVRDWMTRFYTPSRVPIKRFLQLAPANFGSPLAHKGRRILGRIFKGGLANRFQTGTHLLKGLELASPYTWQLAERDLFPPPTGGKPTVWYGKGRILAAVFVGLDTYGGIAGAFAGSGSDGTVRVATANMNATRIVLDMTTGKAPTPQAPPKGIAMLAVKNHDHTRIYADPTSSVYRRYLEALQQDDAGWNAWCSQIAADHERITNWQYKDPADRCTKTNPHYDDDHYDVFQHTVVRVRDEFGQPVNDYLLEVELQDEDERPGFLGRLFQADALHHVHNYGDDKSYRALYVNVSEWKRKIDKDGEAVKIKISASPEYAPDEDGQVTAADRPTDKRHFNVGYAKESIDVPKTKFKAYFAGNRTVLVDIILPRKIDAGIVRIDPLADVEKDYGMD